MKTSSIFWGVFFICIGFFILMQKLSLWIPDFSNFIDFWPIIIILWGISILKLPDFIKKLLAVITAIFLSILILAFINHSWCPFFDMDDHNNLSNKNKYEKKYNERWEILYNEHHKFARLELNGGACTINFKDTTEKLIETYSGFPAVKLECIEKESEEFINLKLDLSFKSKLFKKKKSNEVWVKLNTQPVWDLDFDLGAVDFDCDLSNYKIRDFCIDVGAADVDVTMGNLYESTHMEIDAGASDINIKIPYSSGCKIETSTGLSSEDFKGFLKSNDSYYTSGFENSKHKIIIKISGGVSNFEVERY